MRDLVKPLNFSTEVSVWILLLFQPTILSVSTHAPLPKSPLCTTKPNRDSYKRLHVNRIILQTVNLEDLMKVLDRPLGENELWLFLLGTAKSLISTTGSAIKLFHGKLRDEAKLTNDDILEYDQPMNHQRSEDAEYAKLPKISGFPALNPTMISIDSNGVVRTSETG